MSESVRGMGVADITSTLGLSPFLPSCGALAHAEAVLFVGDDEAEILIGNALGDERVGADDHVPFAA